jgi:hypothetical protein
MRKIILVIVVAVLAGIAWFAWPLMAIYSLARAVEARDIPAIIEQVEPLTIRRSLTSQVIAAYNRVTGTPLPASNLLVAIADTIADPIIARIVTPEGIALLLQSGWVEAELAPRPSEARGFNMRTLGDPWRVFLNSQHKLDRYLISYPVDEPMAQRFELEWRLRGVRWRLATIRLPERLADRLAERLAELIAKPTRR